MPETKTLDTKKPGLSSKQIEEYDEKLRTASDQQEKDALLLYYIYEIACKLTDEDLKFEELNENTKELVTNFFSKLKSPSNFGGQGEKGEELYGIAISALRSEHQ